MDFRIFFSTALETETYHRSHWLGSPFQRRIFFWRDNGWALTVGHVVDPRFRVRWNGDHVKTWSFLDLTWKLTKLASDESHIIPPFPSNFWAVMILWWVLRAQLLVLQHWSTAEIPDKNLRCSCFLHLVSAAPRISPAVHPQQNQQILDSLVIIGAEK